MGQITLPLNIDDIKSGKLSDSLPEFYDLKNAVENSKDGWHQQEPVFDHTLNVLKALEMLLEDNENLEEIFAKKIGNYTRKQLLQIAALFHDIGKKETMIREDGFTKCPGHEKVGVEKTGAILKRFDLLPRDTELVLDIIANHSIFHHLLNPNNQNFEKDLDNLKSKFGNSIYAELIFLSCADTINSKLKIVGPDEFKKRIDFYQAEIGKL